MRFGIGNGFILLAACAALSAVAEVKFIGTGWDTLRLSPEEVLANAPAFAESGLDGINLSFSTKDASGARLTTDNVLTHTKFTYEAVRKYVPVFRKIAANEGLRESLLTVWWCPRKGDRIPWDDDAGWAVFANNMGVMAKLAKEGGLKGLFLDWEDYSNTRQFARTDEDPELAETIRFARQRGQEIGRAVFDAFPDVVFFSYWWLSSQSSIAGLLAEERAHALSESVWVAFFNGLLDVMPDGAKLVDGSEHYHLESFRRDFYSSATAIQIACQGLVAPENRAKYRRAVSASFGHYIDMYVNTDSSSRWYYGPEGGSRLEHFRRNVSQSARAASEYVWIYGEKGLFVPLKGCANGWISRQKTWEELLPGWQNVIREVKRERASSKEALMPKAPPLQAPPSTARPSSAPSPAPDAQGDLPRKFIATGAPIRALATKDILSLADAFKEAGFDGVAVPIDFRESLGPRMGSEGVVWRMAFTAQMMRSRLATLRQFATCDGLRESLVYVSLSPEKKDRIPWAAANRWAGFANNMGMLASVARAAGLKGLFLDAQDRNLSQQFVGIEKGRDFDALVQEARLRGRAVGRAVFKAYPNIVLFSTGWFSREEGVVDMTRGEVAATLKERRSLWPAFVNGILDEMPPTAKFVDGGGIGDRDAEKKDFHKAASDLLAAGRILVADENAGKLRAALSASSGVGLDRYEGEHAVLALRRDLMQAAATSGEYVWIEADAHPLAGGGAAAWDGRVAHWRDAVLQAKDERKWIAKYLKENAGTVRDLVPDPACAKGIGRGYFAYIDRKIAPDAVIDTDTAVGEGDSASFRLKGCKDGTLMFQVLNVKPNDVYIVQFSTKGVPVHAKAAWRENSQFRWNVPSVGLPVAIENAAGWREASRIVRAPDMAGYNEMYLMIDTRDAGPDDVAWVDNVHVYRVSRRD